MKKVDMSSEAITRRLRQTDQLRELSLSLMKAKKETDEINRARAETENNAAATVDSTPGREDAKTQI